VQVLKVEASDSVDVVTECDVELRTETGQVLELRRLHAEEVHLSLSVGMWYDIKFTHTDPPKR
jgi:hypothetical protein